MAAAFSGEQIHEELSCSICLELFTRPKVLPCQHTFCQDCLQDHASRQLMPLQCPNCHLQVSLPPKGIAGLPDGHTAANMCEDFGQEVKQSVETRKQPQSGNRCSFHPSEDFKVFCKQCQVQVCEMCLEESHDGHSTTTIKKAAQERRSTVQDLIEEARRRLFIDTSLLGTLGTDEKILMKQKQETENSIVMAYNQMVQELTETKDYLLSKTEQHHKENLERIQNGRDRMLAVVNEVSTACDQAEQEMEQGGVQFLCQETILTDYVTENGEKYSQCLECSKNLVPQPNAFQPKDIPVSDLESMTVLSLPSAHSATVTDVFKSKMSKITGVVKKYRRGYQMQMAPRDQKVTFGGLGSKPGQFNDPSGVTVSDEGEIFVADRGNMRIQVFTLQGTFIRQFCAYGSEYHWACMFPHDVAMDGEGNLWAVGDSDSVVKYSKKGMLLRFFYRDRTGWERGVAMDTRRNHILVSQSTGECDNPHGEVLVFSTDGTLLRTVSGEWMDWFTSLFWQQRIQMKCPVKISVVGEGNILVSDQANHHVYVYSKYGRFLFQFGGKGSGEGQLKYPAGICTDRAGNIIVADTGNKRVELFDKTGRFLKHITTGIKMPHAVAMATQGHLVVTDRWDNTVSIFPNY